MWNPLRRFGSVLAVLALPALAACAWEADGQRQAAAGEAEVPAGYSRAVFKVEGMTCGGCALAATRALRGVEGVLDAKAVWDPETGGGSAWAVYDPAKVDPHGLAEAIRSLGYSPTLVEG